MSTRGKIPKQALALARKICKRMDVERKTRPMEIFTEEIEGALLIAFDAGQRAARRQAKLKAGRPQDLN